MERTHAAPAHGIGVNIEIRTERERIRPVQDLEQRSFPDLAYRTMKKTRPHSAVRFDHGGHPRGRAWRRNWLDQPEMRPEITGNRA